jgi:hypothetical protein
MITFSDSSTSSESRWILEAEYGDRNNQLSAEAYNEPIVDNTDYHKPSAAYVTFRCRNVGNRDDVSVVKIVMQEAPPLHYYGGECDVS